MADHQYVNQSGEQVTARQLIQDYITLISLWCAAPVVVEHDALEHDTKFQALNVPTPDGPKRATEGDYIVKNSDGSFDVVKPYRFRSVYKEV